MEGAELGKPDYEDFPDKADTCQGFLLDFSRIQKRMEEVREYEPRMALDGGTDGLYFYRKIIEQSPAYLKPDGMLFLEIGYNQAEAVQNLMEQGFTGIRVVKDLAGLDRVVYGRLKPQIDGGKKCLTD